MSGDQLGAASFSGELAVNVKRGGFWRRFNPLLRITDILRSIWL